MIPPERDLQKLVPVFRERVEELVRRMRGNGHDATVWETWRSFARAEELQRKGVGVAMSMHCYGVAADIVSVSKLWSPRPEFWFALGERRIHNNEYAAATKTTVPDAGLAKKRP